jgi:hypothetical protein
MTLNSRRSSWTTRWPKDRPPCSTLCPQVDDALHSSSYLRAHHSRNCHVLRRPLPLQSPTPATMTKARARGKGKARTTAPVAPAILVATTAGVPRCGPPSTISGLAPSRCGQRCVLHSSNRCVDHNTPYSLHRQTTGLPEVPPSHPCR